MPLGNKSGCESHRGRTLAQDSTLHKELFPLGGV